MKSNRLLLLPLAMAAIHATSPASAQQTDELDITITVMEEGETPEGLINRIELPPPDALSGAQTEPVTPPVDAVDDEEAPGPGVDNIADMAEEASQIAEDATDSADDASQVATDRIREIISIDGTDDVVDNLTPPVQDVVDPELPLQDGIELPEPAGDAIGGVGDQVDDATDDATDGVTDTVDDVSDDTTDEVTDTVDDVSDDATDDVSGTTDDVVDNIDDTTDDTTDVVDDTVDDASDTVDQTTSPLQTDDVTDELPDEEIEEETGDDALDDVTGGGAGL